MSCMDPEDGRSKETKVVDVHERSEVEAVRTVGARELLGGRGMLRIEHAGEIYTLRLTRNNRLILTK